MKMVKLKLPKEDGSGYVPVAVLDPSPEFRDIINYWVDVERYLHDGNPQWLKRWENRSVIVSRVTYKLVTDVHTIEKLANAGVVSYE